MDDTDEGEEDCGDFNSEDEMYEDYGSEEQEGEDSNSSEEDCICGEHMINDNRQMNQAPY